MLCGVVLCCVVLCCVVSCCVALVWIGVILVSGSCSAMLCCSISCDKYCDNAGGMVGRVSMNSFACGPTVVNGIGGGVLDGMSIVCCLKSVDDAAAELGVLGGNKVCKSMISDSTV